MFIAILLAFAPVFVSSFAFAQTRAEYDAMLAQAQANISTAQEAVNQAQEAYSQAVASGVSLESEITAARQALANAQQAYETSLIPDPSWVRPTKEIQVGEEVTRSIQVATTSTVTRSELVPRTVSTVIPAGLIASVYNMQGYNNAPPLPTQDRLMFTTTVNNINFNWGGNRVMDIGPYEDTIVKFTGSIYIPENGVYGFYAPGDDGVQVIIDNTRIINDWYDKGGGGSMVTTDLSSGSHSITVWYYENGGGANVWLYWAKPGMGWEIVPASAFGEQVQETTVYDEVIIEEEVTTYTEEIITETVYHSETVPDMDAIHPSIKDPSLLPAILAAQAALDNLTNRKNENDAIVATLSNSLQVKQQELLIAEQELASIPKFIEPKPEKTVEPEPEPEATPEPEPKPEPKPEPSAKPEKEVSEVVSEIKTLTEVAPEDLTNAQVEQLVEAALVVFETAEQGSAEYQQALEALSVAAEADDPELPVALAAIPGAAEVLEVFNNFGNVGADMSPQIREQAEKTVIASVIAAQAAIGAVGAATSAATSAASATSSGGGTSRRIN